MRLGKTIESDCRWCLAGADWPGRNTAELESLIDFLIHDPTAAGGRKRGVDSDMGKARRGTATNVAASRSECGERVPST
jgi:hypothetical protein